MESQREAFMAEILDHLDTLEQDLLNCETASGVGNSGANLQAMFRSAHSLKSSLGMADFPVSSGILHSMEHHLDEHRSSGINLEQDEVDLFLSGLDRVRHNLEATEEQAFTIADNTQILKREQDSEVTSATGTIQSPGMWQVHKTITSSLTEERFKKLPIFKTIDRIGKLITVEPAPSQWGGGDQQITVTITFSSELSSEAIGEEIFDPVLPYRPPPEPAQEPAEVGRRDHAASKELRILIVEDDFATRHLESSLLGTFGSCDVAVDGREALDAFRSVLSNGQSYDLVILDMLLPEIPGLEVLEGMRALEDDFGITGLQRSKIAVVSTVAEHHSIQKSFRRQADAYILKPVTRRKIEAELRRHRILN